jgi:antitoxin component YwqK of YwqJK toxin-antitoxin module
MAMRDFPATSFASASALTSGRELTYEEALEFSRRSLRARIALFMLCVTAPALVVMIAWGGTRERVVERTRYALDGSKEVFAQYMGAKKHGTYVEYHRNGRERIVGKYEQDIPTGTFHQFDWNGRLRSETHYARGRLVGDWTVWQRDGGIESVTPHVGGSIHGKAYTFWPSGRVRSEKPYTHGVVDGVERAYHENGLLASEVGFDGGVPHGPVREWSDAGVLVVEGRHVDGQRDGEWTVRESESAVATVETWADGELLRIAMAASTPVDAKRRVR